MYRRDSSMDSSLSDVAAVEWARMASGCQMGGQ